ncbi:MAG: DUF4347 domain-containing protein, partial [Cyanobacteria bacterium P01_A01_bin.80]
MFIDNPQSNWSSLSIGAGLNNETNYYGLETDDFREIAFVDSQLPNYQSLIDGFDENVQVFLLNGNDNGLNQITQTLENYQNLDAIHLFSHGSAGGVELGNVLLTQDNLTNYQNQLQAWGNSLTVDGDLLFYGCNVAEGTTGQTFLQDVSNLTGADVAGSDDLTGNVAYGGDDWKLEYSTGDIEAETLRGNSSFSEVLATVSLSNDGKLTFDEGIGIINIVSLSAVDNNTNLLIEDKYNLLTAGSNATQVSFNRVKVDLRSIKDIEFKLGFGKDSLSFDSDITFANGQLSSFIIEGEENTLPGLDLVLGDLFGDSVNFNHNLYLGGANLNVSAENITVKENATISTRQVASGGNHLTANSTGDSGELYFTGVNPINITAALGNIQSVEKIEIGKNAQLLSHVEENSSYAAADVWLNARYFSNADIDNLFPVTSPEDWAAKTAKITIGDNAALRGNNIIIKAQAEDKNFSELIGADSLLDNFVIAPLQDRLEEALALPVKVLVRRSNASVDVNTGASLVGLAGVSVEAVATTDSTGKAKGSIVSIGYAHAEASAKVNLKTGVEITAGEAVKIGSEGNATASISTETEATDLKILGTKKEIKNKVGGLSLAVDYAKITSHAVVEQGVTITAGKTANIIALGNKETEAEATSKTSKSGKVSFAFGINISDTDIKADVDGTVTANQNPGAIVKLELDPLKEVTYEFNPSETSVVNTTENTINLTGVAHSLRTGDKIKYTTQAGNNIGGLENDKEYYVVVDPNNNNLVRLANSRTDAFAIDKALKTPENSDDSVITNKTVDLSSIGSLSNTTFAANSAVDNNKDTITFNTTNQFKIGQPIVYRKDTGNVIPGLNDGQVYYVITYSNTDTQQTIQLAETATLARQGIAIDLGKATGSHSLSPLHQFTAKVTDIDTDSIDLAKVFDINDPSVTPHALATGDQVNYTNRRGISIGGVGLGVLLGGETGLVDGEDYYIVTDPNNPNIIRLASSELKALEAYSKLEDDANADLSNLVIDFTDNGGDVAAVNSKTFDPTEIGIVDDTENTIILDNAAFPEGSDFFGTDADFNIFGSTFEIGQAVVYSSGGGKPIGGLEDGKTYYVVTATDENNLDGDNRFFVGKQIIQLADTENKARAGISLDIDPSVATGTEHSFTATHVIDSGLVAGVGVLANLSSSDTSVAESDMNDGDKPGEEDFSLDLIEKAGGAVSGVAKKIFDKLVNGSKNGDYKNKADAGGNNPESSSNQGDSSGKSPLAVAGALGFAYVNNDVIANVGSNAILKSAEDLEVVATIEHEVKLNADSDVGNIADNSGSAAVVVGIYTNNADAIVNSNAQLDAYKASRVIAEVKYPYLTRPDEYIPANLGEFVDLVKSDGYDAVNDYLDGTLGLKSKLLNTWARSTASADNIGVSGSVNLLIFNNDVNAIIKEDAKINQDLAWREKSEDQSLSVEATNYMQMLNLTGVFQFALPSLEIDLGKVEGSSWTPKQIKENNQLLGSDGKTGMGGAFFLMFLDNNTNAIVEDGVSIYSGAAGGFNMKAEEAIMNFNFTQAGSKAESYGIGGTFAYVNQNSNTLAQLSGGTRVEGRSANIYAGSLETHVNWAGGVAVGKNLGFGITVAINDIDRSTDAIIGNYDPSKNENNQATPLENTYISVTDAVTVNAVSDGWLGAFSVAAAVADASPKKPKQTKEGDISKTSEATGKQSKPTSAIGVSGDVSFNQVDDKVRAIVWDAGLLEASTIALSALNETDLYSVAGAVAFAKGGQGKTSVGLAGAASWNQVFGETKAYIKGQGASKQLKLNTDKLTLDAEQKGEIFAITAGGSGAFASGSGNNVSLAGSFSYNEIENTTESYLDGVNTTLSNSAKSVLNITPQSAIANNTINLDKSHSWLNGEKVIYDNGGDSQDITGLVSGKAYYVITDSNNPNSFKLATTEANAKNNIALSINGAGITGTSHSFTANNPLPVSFQSNQIQLDETKENTISFGKNHGWEKYTAVIYDNGGGKSISGLTHGNTYYVVTDDRNGKVLKLATNDNGTEIVNLNPSIAEGEGHRFYEDSTPSSTQIIDFREEHNWFNSDIVTYRNENGAVIGGLEDGEQYYVIVVDSTKIKLAKTPGGNAMNLNFRTATGDKHSLQRSVVGNSDYKLFTFDPVKDNAFKLSQVEVKENFALDNPHDFTTGQAVVYDNDGGTSIGGLTNGETYYVIVDEDPNTFRLANSEIEAKLGFAIGLDPTTMTGDNHQFFPNSSVISAKDKSKIFAVAGGATISLGGQKGGGLGFGFAWNDIDNTTKALVQNSTLSHDDSLQVIASNNSDIQTISASIGISQAQKFALTIAGTASVNSIDNVTEAAIINTNNGTVDDTSGLLRVKAVDEADIKSLSGAVSVAISGKTSVGFGVAVAYNVIGTQSGHSTKAYISNSSIYVEDLDITANSNQLIQSISATAAGAKSGKAAVTVAGSVSINTIGDSQTAAYISGSPNVVVDRGINIKASNKAKIQSISGQVAVSFGSKGGGAIGAAVAVNEIDKTSDSNNEIGVHAYINSSKVTSNSDRFDINIEAVSTSTIETISAGVQIGGGAKLGVAGGGSVSVNTIVSTVSSYIANNADVTSTKRNINLEAEDKSNIIAIAGQAAIAGGKAAAAVGVAWADNDIKNQIKSYIDKSKVVTNSGSINLDANSTAKIETLSAGAQIVGGKAAGAFGGSRSNNTIANTISSYISNSAEVTANQNLDVTTKDKSTIRSLAGQIAIAGGKAAAGVGVAWATNEVKNQVNSYINEKSQVTTNIGSININANSDADIQTISAGIQVAGGKFAGAAGGSVSSNTIENKINSYIAEDADVRANQNLDIKAEDESNIIAIAGQAAIAGGKAAAAVGVAWADNDIKNQVKSYIDKSKVVTTNGSININADSTAKIETLSAGAQIAGGKVGIAAGGSRSNNTIANTISSYISNSAEVRANQNLDVIAKDKSTIRSLAGQVAIALGKAAAGVGVAWATNEVKNQVNSYINQNSQVTTNIGSININANSDADIQTISAGIQVAGGGLAGAAGGSVSSNTVENKINSYIAEDADVRANQNLDIKAEDESKIRAIAGQAAIALGKAAGAVGVAWADNDIKNQVNSYIDKSKVVTNSGSINVNADSTATIETLSAGAQIAGGAVGIAAGGSTSINTIANTISSYIGNNSNVTAEQNINLKTNDKSTIRALAGQVAIAVGKGSGTIGVALAENDIENNINSYIEGSTVKSNKESIDINAISKAKIETLSAVASVSGGVVSGSVAVSISHNQIKNKINSFIINSTDISAQKDIIVQATDNSEIKSLSGGAALAISIGGGAGAAYSYNNIDNETQAYTNSTLNSQAGNIVISADSKGKIETIAVSMGASLVVGAAGSIAINEMANQTSAYVDGGNLTAYGSIGISSQSRNEVTTYGGTIGGGLVGFGATVVVNNIDNDTKAYTTNNANLAGKGHLSLDLLDTTINGVSIFAVNNEDIEVKSGTASLGGFSFAGTVVVNSIENTTQAYAEGSKINDDLNGANNSQNVWVKALSDSKIDVLGGALSISKAGGIGGTIDINSIINDTRAYIGDNATVKAKNNILVEAIGSKNVDSIVVAGTVSGSIGFAGAVSINTLGSSISQKGIEAADKASKTLIDQIKNIDQYSDKIATDKSIIELFNIRVVKHGTQAFTGNNANLQAGGNIAIQAKETSKVSSLAGGGSIGLVGVGGAVSVIEIKHNTQAFAGNNTVLDAQGDIKVKAEGDINSDPEVYAGAAGAIGLGAAVSYLTTKNDTAAYIGDGAVIKKANNVNVLAGSSSNLKAEGWGAAAGAAAAGVVIASAKESGTTQAYLGNGVKIENTNNLNVKATAKHAVSAESQAAAGGILSGNGSIPTATVSPTVKAYIGNNSNIQVNGDVAVISDVTVDGDAEAKGVSIGAVAVGASIAKVNAKPNIDTYVGTSAVINAKNITVKSLLGEPIKVPDTSFNPGSAVNTTQNTIKFSGNHGFNTGDSLVYSNGGDSDIGGLQNENSYNVIRVDGKTVKLGSEFNAAEVDVKFNTIKFSGSHGFKDGDEVVYQASGGSAIGGLVSNRKYYVRVIDSNTIKLSTNSSYSANIQGAKLEKIDTSSIETNINIENHGFQNNDVINYQRRTAQFNIVKEISEDAKGEDNIFNLSNDIASNDTIKSASHGFETNDKVIYSTTGTVLGGLENGKEYYIIKVDDNNFKLSTKLSTSEEEAPAINITSADIDTSHKITAVGLKIEELEEFNFTYNDDSQNTNTVTKNNHGFTDSQEVVYQTNGTGLNGLTVGETYYIKTIDANKFQLSATQNGTAIDFGANNDNHQLVIKKGVQELEEGVSYYVIRDDENNFKLSTTKDGTALTLSKEHLNGNGFNHLFAKDDVIDLTNASTGTHNFHIDLTSKGSGEKHQLSAGASATVPSQGDNKFSVYAQASAGALVGGNATRANLDITPTMKTYVGNQASITATGNVKITSLSSIEATGTSNSKILGAIAVGSSKIESSINNQNNTYVGSGAQIKADGNVDITGQSDQTLNISGYGGAGSAITFADADAHATITHNTDTKINNNANIISNDTLTVRSSSNTNGNVKVRADGVGAYADADAKSSIRFNGSNNTTVNGRLEARKLNVEAIVDTLKVESRSDSYGAGAIGNIDAEAKVDLSNTKALVNIGSGAYLKGDDVKLDARYKTVQSNAIALADCDGLGGDTDTTAENIMPIEAKVLTNSNSTLEVYELDVIADVENFNRTTTAKSDKAFSIRIPLPFGKSITITMDFGSETRRETYKPTPVIDFNSTVILDRRDVNPVLIIDEKGDIAQISDNITINNTSTEIIVNDIDNVKVGGINFIIPQRTNEAFSNGLFIDRGKYEVKDPAYETVQITNNSNKDLVVNDISVINIVGLPETEKYGKVNVQNIIRGATTISPQSPLAVNPTIVTIENNNSNSNLVLQGTIDSPHDRTELVSKGGIIGRDGHRIITRDLSLTAENGSIGTDSQRIVATINQGYEPVTDDVPSENINLQIEAKDSIFLDLTAKQIDNNPVTVNVEKMTATEGDVNLLINQTTDSLNTAVSALYEFNKIISGNDITINADTTSTNIKGNTDFVDNTSFSDDEVLTNIDGNTSNIKGSLDVVTNGSINLTEVEGGLNLKQLVSANEDIQITVNETSEGNENLLLIDNAKVSAAKDITLLVGDDFQINSTAQIKSDQKVVVEADYNNGDSEGSLVNIFGAIYSQQTQLYTGKDFDTFNVRRIDSKTNLRSRSGDDTINIGSEHPSNDGLLDDISATLTISGGIGEDILNLDDSGDTTDNIAIVNDTQINGLGMNGEINYGSFESVNLELGSGSDILAVESTHDGETNINTGEG